MLIFVGMKRFISMAIAAAIAVSGIAQERSDTLTTPWPMTLDGVPALAVGSVSGLVSADFRSSIGPMASHGNSVIDNVAPYSPLAVTAVLKLCGVKTRSSWGRLAVSSAFSGLLMAGMGQGLKHVVSERRPGATGNDAFPSGHTTAAFACAAIMSRELGWRSPWYSIGAYTAASAVGLSRVMRGRHWAGDVVFGAGLGITATNVGYFLTDLIFRDRGLADGYRAPGAGLLPERPSFLGIGMELATGRRLRLPAMLGGMRLDLGAVAATSVEGAWFITPRWGVGGRLRVASAPLGVAGSAPEGAPMDFVGADASAWFSQPLAGQWALTAKAFAGATVTTATSLGDGALRIDAATAPMVGAGIGVIRTVRCGTALRLGADYTFTAPDYTYTLAGAGTASRVTPVHSLAVTMAVIALF